mgnify:CR=1 FL=1
MSWATAQLARSCQNWCLKALRAKVGSWRVCGLDWPFILGQGMEEMQEKLINKTWLPRESMD